MEQKPIKAKPVFYAMCYEPLKAIAKDMGYNLLINGSLNRDFDLVAIPWVNNPKPMLEVVIEFDKYLKGTHFTEESANSGYMYSVLEGGRHSYVINLNRGGKWSNYTDYEWYVDISFTPLSQPDPLAKYKLLVQKYEELELVYAVKLSKDDKSDLTWKGWKIISELRAEINELKKELE